MPRNALTKILGRRRTTLRGWSSAACVAFVLSVLLQGPALADLPSVDDTNPPAEGLDELAVVPHDFGSPLAPDLPDPTDLPVQLVLDDDSAEGVFGILGGTARQFLWFNSFASPGDFRLEEIWVLFPDGPDVPLGGDVQLAVFQDPDGDPTNGAQLLATYDETIQVVDGTTFSVYELDPPLDFQGGGDLLVGVVNRYYQTGIDPPPTEPAAVDTTASQGRSYFALWSGDAPADLALGDAILIDVLADTSAGNHMIRAFGGSTPAIDVPTLGGAGLLLLIAALGLGGFALIRRRLV